MDKITIERETLERLVRWIGGSRAIIETDLFNDLRAALAAQPAEPVACKGIPRKGCNYLAPTDTVCNKCGKIHHHHQMLAHFYAASPAPAAVPPGYVLVPVEPTQAMISAMMTSEARDAEGPFPMLMDHLDYGGENKSHTVLKAAYRAMIAARATQQQEG